jgi:sigma-E factor negative regulatory protein RseC
VEPVLTETGRVVAVEDDTVWIETIRQSVCGACAAQKGCGHGLLNQLGDGHRSYLQLSSNGFPGDAFSVDDQVSIGIPEQLLVQGSFVVYLLPLMTMLVAAAIGPALMPGLAPFLADMAAIAGAVTGLLVGVFLVRVHARYHRNNSSLQPRLLGLA